MAGWKRRLTHTQPLLRSNFPFVFERANELRRWLLPFASYDFFSFLPLLLGPILLLNYDFAGCFTAGHLLNPGISATAE
jgi:hypothetical protein